MHVVKEGIYFCSTDRYDILIYTNVIIYIIIYDKEHL